MCTGKSYHFEACGHAQSSYILICQQSHSSKANTDCDRLVYTPVKDGVCPACMQKDAQIEKLRCELRLKERELNEAISMRSGTQGRALVETTNHPNGMNVVHGNSKEMVLPSRERNTGRIASYHGVKIDGSVIPVELRKLHHDILEISNSWWRERSICQATLSSFQVKSLGPISYKDRIAKCNKAREELINARFKQTEEDLIKGYD